MTWRGPLRLPARMSIPAQVEQVATLPDADAPSPRRRRNYICPYLRVGGKPVTSTKDLTSHNISISYGRDIEDAYCTVRHIPMKGAWIFDTCCSSWGNPASSSGGCPFLPEKERAA